MFVMLFLALNRVKEVLYFLETHSKDTASCESSYFKNTSDYHKILMA